MFSGGPQADDCGALRLNDSVASPDPGFVFTVGRMLDVVLHPGPPTTVVLEERSTGAGVGALHPIPALLRCLTDGVPFQAEVLSAIGGDVRVRVAPIL